MSKKHEEQQPKPPDPKKPAPNRDPQPDRAKNDPPPDIPPGGPF
jgi:hypothetical protein